MSSGLSQAEIDALLNGGAAPADETPPAADPDAMMTPEQIEALLAGAGNDAPAAPPPAEDPGAMMTPEQIEALLAGAGNDAPAEPATTASVTETTPSAEHLESFEMSALNPEDVPEDKRLSPMETDAMGEIGNISMGTSATTLSTLLSHKVDITTPVVTLTTMRRISKEYPLPFVATEVKYTKGLEGTNILFLREHDVKIITDLMMGGDGSNTSGELGELHLSAISEVMNQMVGSSSTSMAKLMGISVDIAPPQSYSVNLEKDAGRVYSDLDEIIVRTSFQMVVDGLIDSAIMQVMPVDFARRMVSNLINGGATAAAGMSEPSAPPPGESNFAPSAAPPPPSMPGATRPGESNFAPSMPAPPPSMPGAQPPPGTPPPQYAQQPPPQYAPPPQYSPYGGQPPMQPQQPYPPYPDPYAAQQPPPGYPPAPYPYPAPPPMPYGYPPSHQPVVAPASFGTFGAGAAEAFMGENMDLLMDVPLTVSVELGKSSRHIKDILDFNIGSIVVLDKMAGESVDIVVNGKLIAKGEVVVIDDNYGARITDIVTPSNRIPKANRS